MKTILESFEKLFKYNHDEVSDEFIEHLIHLFNNYMVLHSSKPHEHIIIIDRNSPKKEYLQILKRKLGCQTLKCVLKHGYIKYSDEKLENIFLTNMKIKSNAYESNQWLSNLDIDKVMNQFEYLFLNFLYTGTVRLDFDHTKMEKIFLEYFLMQTNKKIKCFHYQKNYCSRKKYNIDAMATVYNTATSKDLVGKHWITTFSQKIDEQNIYIYFFDSVGNPIPYLITNFFEKIKQKVKKNNINICLFSNLNIRHQIGKSECGLYAIYFIKKLLEESASLVVYKNIFANTNNKLQDKNIQKYRSVFFKKNKFLDAENYISDT